ncbi:acylphosphatase [Denitratisoma sp. agr-D3]
MEVRRLLIRGRVQGVYYRASMVQEARKHGATGWVRNLSDGRVEAVVHGHPEVVARMIAWARIGPAAAVVEEVLVEEADGSFTDFVQVATL